MARVSIVLLAALLVLALPGPASARRAPQGYYGVTWDSGYNSRPAAVQDAQWDRMARSGVESVRTVFSWAIAQPRPGEPASFAETDPLVYRAAARRIRVLPIVFETPNWARAEPDLRNSPPADPHTYASYLAALVDRYGRWGSFWSEHPELPRRPITDWQIWNEPDLIFYWNTSSDSPYTWPGGYLSLLAAARDEIKSRDPEARIVLGGLSADSGVDLKRLYHYGGRRLFDVVAVHPYNKDLKSVLWVVGQVHKVMRRYHDNRKPVWITELGWPAARGRAHAEDFLATIVTTDRGMAKRVRSAYDFLLRRRRSKKWGVSRLYWFTWASNYGHGEGGVWEYAGLNNAASDSFAAMPALAQYRRSARRNEGCAKGAHGRCR